MKTRIIEQFNFMPKSKIKAGEGKPFGLYPFFTSSDVKRLFLDDYVYNDELIIIGTGGNPSCNYYNGKFSASTDNFVLKSKGIIKTKYLYYFLRHNNFSLLAHGFHGISIKHLGKEYLSNLEIYVNPKYSQDNVVNNLDGINSSLSNENHKLRIINELIKSQFV